MLVERQCSTRDYRLPEASWWEDYYNPLRERHKMLREKHHNDKEWIEHLDAAEKEIEMYKKDSQYYGYVFFVMKSID